MRPHVLSKKTLLATNTKSCEKCLTFVSCRNKFSIVSYIKPSHLFLQIYTQKQAVKMFAIIFGKFVSVYI